MHAVRRWRGPRCADAQEERVRQRAGRGLPVGGLGVQTATSSSVNAPLAWSLLDRPRASLYRVAAPWFRALYADRDRRVAWLALASVTISLGLTLSAPLWLLALGPVLLGVPHLLADVRYLVVQPNLHRAGSLWLCLPPLVLVGAGAPAWVGVLALVPPLVIAPGRLRRKAALGGGAVVLFAAAWCWERPFVFSFVHAHNVLALAIWWTFRPRGWRAALVLGLIALVTTALLLGLADPVITVLRGWEAPSSGASMEAFIESTSPVADPELALHLVLVFAFLQSLHYAVWLRLIPDDARRRPAPRPFAESWRALVSDFGVAPLVIIGALALGIAAWGAVDLHGARWGYLRLAAFHGWLELAVITWWLAGGRRA